MLINSQVTILQRFEFLSSALSTLLSLSGLILRTFHFAKFGACTLVSLRNVCLERELFRWLLGLHYVPTPGTMKRGPILIPRTHVLSGFWILFTRTYTLMCVPFSWSSWKWILLKRGTNISVCKSLNKVFAKQFHTCFTNFGEKRFTLQI